MVNYLAFISHCDDLWSTDLSGLVFCLEDSDCEAGMTHSRIRHEILVLGRRRRFDYFHYETSYAGSSCLLTIDRFAS